MALGGEKIERKINKEKGKRAQFYWLMFSRGFDILCHNTSQQQGRVLALDITFAVAQPLRGWIFFLKAIKDNLRACCQAFFMWAKQGAAENAMSVSFYP